MYQWVLTNNYLIDFRVRFTYEKMSLLCRRNTGRRKYLKVLQREFDKEFKK